MSSGNMEKIRIDLPEPPRREQFRSADEYERSVARHNDECWQRVKDAAASKDVVKTTLQWGRDGPFAIAECRL